MAIGETIVGTLWQSFAGICIEKLLDELLKVKLCFSFVSLFLFSRSEWNQSEEIRFQRVSRHEPTASQCVVER